jgi:hypothetical protein
VIDVLNDAGGREQLLKLGVRNVPVVAKGENYVFGQNLEDVAEFVGLQGTGHKPLPAPELLKKWVMVLRAIQRYMRQMPVERINENVIENRQRSIRLLGHHAIRIAEAYLETAENGVEYSIGHANVPPADGTFLTGPEIAGYGEEVIRRLQKWWDGLPDKSLAWKIKTYYGMQPMAQVFERSTWHSAQHSRQLAHVLERMGIAPEGKLTPGDLAGLPLPERLFE